MMEVPVKRRGRLLEPSDRNGPRLWSKAEAIGAGDRLVTLAWSAEAWGVTTAAVRKWILQRRVPVVRVGRCVRVRLSTVEQIMRDGLPGEAAR